MKLGVSQSPVQSDDAGSTYIRQGLVSYVSMAESSASLTVRVMLVGGCARPRKHGGSWVETPAMVVWTSSSGMPVQAYRAVMVAEALAVRRAGRAAVAGAVLRFGRLCDHAATSYSSGGALDSVHRRCVRGEQRQRFHGCSSRTGRSGVPGSTSTRSSMCQLSCRGEFLCRVVSTAACGRIPHIFNLLLCFRVSPRKLLVGVAGEGFFRRFHRHFSDSSSELSPGSRRISEPWMANSCWPSRAPLHIWSSGARERTLSL